MGSVQISLHVSRCIALLLFSCVAADSHESRRLIIGGASASPDAFPSVASLQRLDEQNIQTAVANSESWFKKALDRSAIESMYVPIVKTPSSAEYKPTVKTKVKIGEAKNTEIFLAKNERDDDGSLLYEPTTYEAITKGCRCLAVVESSGLWFASRQFGMSLVVTNLMIWKNQSNTSFSFKGPTRLKRTVDAAFESDPLAGDGFDPATD